MADAPIHTSLFLPNLVDTYVALREAVAWHSATGNPPAPEDLQAALHKVELIISQFYTRYRGPQDRVLADSASTRGSRTYAQALLSLQHDHPDQFSSLDAALVSRTALVGVLASNLLDAKATYDRYVARSLASAARSAGIVVAETSNPLAIARIMEEAGLRASYPDSVPVIAGSYTTHDLVRLLAGVDNSPDNSFLAQDRPYIIASLRYLSGEWGGLGISKAAVMSLATQVPPAERRAFLEGLYSLAVELGPMQADKTITALLAGAEDPLTLLNLFEMVVMGGPRVTHGLVTKREAVEMVLRARSEDRAQLLQGMMDGTIPPLTPDGADRPSLLRWLEIWGTKRAIVDRGGTHSYAELARGARRVAGQLLQQQGTTDLRGVTIATLLPPSNDWATTQFGIWMAGGIAVPLFAEDPPPTIGERLRDSQARVLIVSAELKESMRPVAEELGIALVTPEELASTDPIKDLPAVSPGQDAMILFTSGSSGMPKGVVLTHANLAAQTAALRRIWRWRPTDRILQFLPLNHLHGVMGITDSALQSGATVEMMPRFDAAEVWNRIASGEITLLMAVPPIYDRLIKYWEAQDQSERARLAAGARSLRLTISGSGRLSTATRERWAEITGGQLLRQRYGSTETGLWVVQPIDGDFDPTSVGIPIPGVEWKILDDDRKPV
ncbi:MAG: AMP-binding protein, partial [Deltaproteobacteria bacterium]|nr:AMP-binding protein [Deltaproteobacteria bacterium]